MENEGVALKTRQRLGRPPKINPGNGKAVPNFVDSNPKTTSRHITEEIGLDYIPRT
ncbi:hypothetical protein Trydic_g12314, partial [Trypoxylus dichotomus]